MHKFFLFLSVLTHEYYYFFSINSRYKLACVISYAFLMHVARLSMKWTCRGGMANSQFFICPPYNPTKSNRLTDIVATHNALVNTAHKNFLHFCFKKLTFVSGRGVDTPNPHDRIADMSLPQSNKRKKLKLLFNLNSFNLQFIKHFV